MTYTYQDLCAWRKEAQVELKKQKAKLDRSKSFSGKVDNVKKGLGFFGKICESGAIQRIVERIRK